MMDYGDRNVRIEGGVRLEIRVQPDGRIKAYCRDYSDTLILNPGDVMIFDVGVDSKLSHDVVFSTATFVVRDK